jgi:hypothetical protein
MVAAIVSQDSKRFKATISDHFAELLPRTLLELEAEWRRLLPETDGEIIEHLRVAHGALGAVLDAHLLVSGTLRSSTISTSTNQAKD